MTKFTGKPQLPPAPSFQWPVMGWSLGGAVPKKAAQAPKPAQAPLGFMLSKRGR